MAYTCLSFTGISLTGCRNSSDMPISKTDLYFDTVITITLYGDDEKYIDACFEICDKYERLFNKNLPDSEISRINENSRNGKYTTVSDETVELIRAGLEYSRLSKGKFDITIGELSNLWNFGAVNSESPNAGSSLIPSDEEINKKIKNIGYEQVHIQGNEILITNPDASIDLGGIAKGFIADKLKAYLLEHHVKKGIINLGGNILLIGSKPDNSNYNIGIQMPFDSDGATIAVISTKNQSIVTSGVYERYFYENDVMYHHILDTKTGYPADNELLSVTIISDTSVEGDGLSTSAFLYGLNDGIDLIESIENVEAVFIDKEYRLHVTSGLFLENGYIYIR